ncbi:MAG: hypothetical protein B1H04_02260 [Planctomycetales bacterium 4484_123]|nr:MAG: hypothetical protein B1H04_02260 [Planctomycetales bacterium 4484_123]
MDAPAGVAVNVMAAKAGLVVHVLNYADQPARDVAIHLTPGAHLRGSVKQVLPLGAGSEQARDIRAENGLSFTLPEVGKYTAVVVG